MKKILLLIYMMFPVLVMAQGHKGEVDECAPMKNGKVCYSDDVEIENTSKLEIFNAINAWAKKSYGKDVFLSNVNSNKNKGTIFVSSKVELLLKIEVAKELIRTNHMNFTQISAHLGYTSIHYFSRQFKKIVGASTTDTRSRRAISYINMIR